MTLVKKLWIGVAVLIVLSPIGLILPDHFKAGPAWGEWGTDGVKKLVGYVPQGLAKLSGLWKAPMPGYAFKGWEEKGLTQLSFAYIISAIVGIGLVVVAVLFLGKVLAKKDD